MSLTNIWLALRFRFTVTFAIAYYNIYQTFLSRVIYRRSLRSLSIKLIFYRAMLFVLFADNESLVIGGLKSMSFGDVKGCNGS